MQTHRRYNPLTEQWILVCSARTKRPWQGSQESATAIEKVAYDPDCYLCPGNKRAQGDTNPNYQSTFIFDNDFSSLMPATKTDKVPNTSESDDLFRHQPVNGICRVLCFSPRHDLTLPNMSLSAIEQVIRAWREQFIELSQIYQWVQIFENKGQIMGCSNPHPHGQIWASDFLPNEIAQENKAQKAYAKKHQRSLLLDYAQAEINKKERIVDENADWLVVVPYWATWPFETLLLPKAPLFDWSQLTSMQHQTLAQILQSLLKRYDRLFQVTFPYSVGWHCAPKICENKAVWQLHAHFYPPLLRSAEIKKFMVGYEMLAEPQRDFTPEHAAQRLREV